MSIGGKSYLSGTPLTLYNRSVGESANNPFANLNVTPAEFLRSGRYPAPGERITIPNSAMVARWIRVRGTGTVRGTTLKAYSGRSGTASAGTIADITTAATLLLDDIGGALLTTTGGTGPNQFKQVYDSDGATTASKLRILPTDNLYYLEDSKWPERFDPAPDATTTWSIDASWESTPTSAATDLVSCVALGTVTDGYFTMVIEEGPVPTLLVGSTDAATAGGLVVPSGTAGTAKGMIGTPANVTAAMVEASRWFGRSYHAYSGSAAVRLVDLFGKFKQ